MTVLDVYLNDRKVCRAGVGADGVLNAMVSWARLTGQAASMAKQMKAPAEEARLHVGGLRGDTHRTWSDRMLQVGDRLSVVIGRSAKCDPPARRTRRDPEEMERLERAHYMRLKQRFEAPRLPSRRSKEVTRGTRFLNVDLDIRSRLPLDPLVAAFGRHVVVLYAGREGRRHGAHLELSGWTDDADRMVRRFTAMVAGLPRPAKRLWKSADARVFSIGVQAEAQPHSYELELEPETLMAVARVNARIGLTVYGIE